jgi:hypothetical protein
MKVKENLVNKPYRGGYRRAIAKACVRYLGQYSKNVLEKFYREGNLSRGEKLKRRKQSTGNEWDHFADTCLSEFMSDKMNFLRQPTISLCVHPNGAALAEFYLGKLVNDPFAQQEILPKLYDPPIGNPFFTPAFQWASPTSMQHAHHYLLMHKYLNIFIPYNEITHVCEFGGGYGNLARLALNWGFQGDWHIIDIPEMHNIQEFYLGHATFKAQHKQIKFCQVKNQETWIKSTKGKSIFIATFSLSEATDQDRTNIEPHLINDFDYIFFAYNGKFYQNDCEKYFNELKEKLGATFIVHQFKDQVGQFYMLCGKK